MELPDYSKEHQRMEEFRFTRLLVEHLMDHHGLSHNQAVKWLLETQQEIEQMIEHRRAVLEG